MVVLASLRRAGCFVRRRVFFQWLSCGSLVCHLAGRTFVVLTFLTQGLTRVLKAQVCGYGRKLRRSCLCWVLQLGLPRGVDMGKDFWLLFFYTIVAF